MLEQSVSIDNIQDIAALFGSYDENIKLVKREFNVLIVSRGNSIKISGDPDNVMMSKKVIETMLSLISKGEALTEQRIRYVMSLIASGDTEQLNKPSTNCVCVTSNGKPIRVKTFGQEKYINAIRKNTVVLSIGPAGTGKTYLAVAMAVNAFRTSEVKRIILTRPAVEAGEKLGFLPGDLQNKVDPYLRPLYDALFDMMGPDSFQRNMERGNIEVAPLAYMRGRTLDDSFIILDEAQNTTSEQMKMFLTRLGFRSKAVITGDITQIDLPDKNKSGLLEVIKILKGIDGIDIVNFTEKDVVRHRLVQDIIKAYDKYNKQTKSKKDQNRKNI
ncbi:MAG: PhoH family protein [Oscillospiraceae bacterium]|nr:PhoH family protein [Oscillospiraceae bacterium]